MQPENQVPFQQIIQQAPIGICILHADTLVAEIVNTRFTAVAGKPYEAIYGQYYWDSFAEARAAYEPALNDVIKNGKTFYADEVELTLIRHGAPEKVVVSFVYDPLVDESGRVNKVAVWVLEDTGVVAIRQQLEYSKAALQVERDSLTRFLMQAPAGICILNGPQLQYEFVNSIYQQMLTGRELMGRPIFEALPELVGTPLEHILREVYKTGEPFIINELLVPVARYEGGPTFDRYFNLTYQARVNETGQVDGIIIFAYEVTGIVRIQQDLQAEKAQADQQRRTYEAISSGTPDLMYVFGMDYRFTYANAALLAMWGKTKEDAIGKTLLENGYEPWHAEMHEKEIDDIKATGRSIRGEVSFPHATLGKRMYDYILTPVFDEQKQVIAVAGVTRDVTERKHSEDSLAALSQSLQQLNEEMAATNEELTAANEELTAANEELANVNQQLEDARHKIEQREASLQLAVSAANFGSWHIHSITREFITDARLKELFGYYPDEPLTIEQAIAQIREDFRQYVSETLENAIYHNGDYDVTYPVIGLHDNRLRWLRAIGNLKADPSGEFAAFTGLVMDVTEQQLKNQRKNDFIGMVSHELKTPITSLYGYLQLMEDPGEHMDEAGREYAVGKCMQQVKKMTRMIDSFLNIARLESGKILIDKTSFSLNELLEELEQEMKPVFITHELVFEHGPPIHITADREKIAQVINNLLSNAVKYSPHGSSIKIHTSVADDAVTIHVTDTGAGIDTADLPHIFERFYRADSSQLVAGFGIGLYLCAEIIRLHDGSINVESTKGNGSHFYFSLPL